MKKLFALVLALTMLVGLVACSDPAEAQPTEAKQETTAAPAGETEAAAAAGEKGVIYGIYKAGDRLGSSTKATLPRQLLKLPATALLTSTPR